MITAIPRNLQPDKLAHLRHATPFLAMDLRTVLDAYRSFRRYLPSVAVHYAMKCNPDPHILSALYQAGCSFEIASYTELNDLQRIGVWPADVLYSNPVKPWTHIKQAHEAGVYRFAFDSFTELEKLARHAPGACVYVRLQTIADSSQLPSEGKYGVSLAAARGLMHAAKGFGLVPYGIAFHVGSQMDNAYAWAAMIAHSAQLMRVLAEEGIELQMLDIGGGFPAQYADGHRAPSIQELAPPINEALAELPYKVEVAAEPGRALVANAGVMVASVIGLAERFGKQWAHLDVGAFNGLMEALESNNQFRFPLLDTKQSAVQAPFHLTGPSCDSQDTILFDAHLSADLSVNDRVYLYAAGAYTTAYASTFNGFQVPNIYMAGPAPIRSPFTLWPDSTPT
jgi:ornithine decarboxylase